MPISEYWQTSYTRWSIKTWNKFYLEEYRGTTNRELHNDLSGELRMITELLGSKAKERLKVLALVFYAFSGM